MQTTDLFGLNKGWCTKDGKPHGFGSHVPRCHCAVAGQPHLRFCPGDEARLGPRLVLVLVRVVLVLVLLVVVLVLLLLLLLLLVVW